MNHSPAGQNMEHWHHHHQRRCSSPKLFGHNAKLLPMFEQFTAARDDSVRRTLDLRRVQACVFPKIKGIRQGFSDLAGRKIPGGCP
jgi:hypothetical protein